MKILQEVTDWDVPNHIYFTNDSKDKIYAYIKASGTAVERFKVPMKFNQAKCYFFSIILRKSLSSPKIKKRF